MEPGIGAQEIVEERRRCQKSRYFFSREAPRKTRHSIMVGPRERAEGCVLIVLVLCAVQSAGQATFPASLQCHDLPIRKFSKCFVGRFTLGTYSLFGRLDKGGSHLSPKLWEGKAFENSNSIELVVDSSVSTQEARTYMVPRFYNHENNPHFKTAMDFSDQYTGGAPCYIDASDQKWASVVTVAGKVNKALVFNARTSRSVNVKVAIGITGQSPLNGAEYTVVVVEDDKFFASSYVHNIKWNASVSNHSFSKFEQNHVFEFRSFPIRMPVEDGVCRTFKERTRCLFPSGGFVSGERDAATLSCAITKKILRKKRAAELTLTPDGRLLAIGDTEKESAQKVLQFFSTLRQNIESQTAQMRTVASQFVRDSRGRFLEDTMSFNRASKTSDWNSIMLVWKMAVVVDILTQELELTLSLATKSFLHFESTDMYPIGPLDLISKPKACPLIKHPEHPTLCYTACGGNNLSNGPCLQRFVICNTTHCASGSSFLITTFSPRYEYNPYGKVAVSLTSMNALFDRHRGSSRTEAVKLVRKRTANLTGINIQFRDLLTPTEQQKALAQAKTLSKLMVGLASAATAIVWCITVLFVVNVYASSRRKSYILLKNEESFKLPSEKANDAKPEKPPNAFLTKLKSFFVAPPSKLTPPRNPYIIIPVLICSWGKVGIYWYFVFVFLYQ